MLKLDELREKRKHEVTFSEGCLGFLGILFLGWVGLVVAALTKVSGLGHCG